MRYSALLSLAAYAFTAQAYGANVTVTTDEVETYTTDYCPETASPTVSLTTYLTTVTVNNQVTAYTTICPVTESSAVPAPVPTSEVDEEITTYITNYITLSGSSSVPDVTQTVESVATYTTDYCPEESSASPANSSVPVWSAPAWTSSAPVVSVPVVASSAPVVPPVAQVTPSSVAPVVSSAPVVPAPAPTTTPDVDSVLTTTIYITKTEVSSADCGYTPKASTLVSSSVIAPSASSNYTANYTSHALPTSSVSVHEGSGAIYGASIYALALIPLAAFF